MDGLCAVALYNRGKGLFSEWNSGNDEWRSFPRSDGGLATDFLDNDSPCDLNFVLNFLAKKKEERYRNIKIIKKLCRI